MSYRFDIKGLEVETRVPKLVELTSFRETRGAFADSYDACRALIKATIVSPSFVDLTTKRSGCIVDLGWKILRACGFDASGMRELAPDEIQDAAMAEAYESFRAEREKRYADEDDERRIVRPVIFVTELGDERAFLMRMPIESEVGAYRKANTVQAAKLFAKKIVLWGDVDSLESELPGLYAAIAENAIEWAGSGEARRLGEA